MARQVLLRGNAPNDHANAESFYSATGKLNDMTADLYALTSRIISVGDVRFAAAQTPAARVQMAINQAALELATIVFVGAEYFGYDATAVTFNPAIRMVREGGAFDVADVKAYGAKADGVSDDWASFVAAFAAADAENGRVIIPSNAGLRYIIANTLQVPPNIRIEGQSAGNVSPILRFTGGAKTCFNFVGTAEAQEFDVSFRDFQVESATAGVGIGLRLRNFADCQLIGMNFNHFRVGVWADWGQNLYLTGHCQFVLNTRAVQLGGDLAQTETPVPAAGIRGSIYPYLDMCVIRDAQFSQNAIDINDMGSQVSLGVLQVESCRFFESQANPVAGKSKFLNIVRRKGFSMTNCFIESPNASRIGLLLSQYDYEGTFGSPNYGFEVKGNHFLMTATSSVTGIYVERGSGVIENNTIEMGLGATSRHVVLADPTNAVRIGLNEWMDYADVEAEPKILNSGGAVHDISRPTRPFVKTLPYSASMTVDPYRGEQFIVTATNGTAFAFVVTTANKRIGRFSITIINGAGGALGAATFTGITLTGGAWVQPADTKKKTLTVEWDGAAFVEVSRSANEY